MRALVLAFVLVACGSENIDLTKPPATDSGTTSLRCSQLGDCPSGSYCHKNTCGESTGTCELFPAQCTNEDEPVCGCDRITYFNDCLRRASGIAASTPGPCRFQDNTPCGGMKQTPCPDGSLCAKFLGPGPCPMDAMGSCWVIPATCPGPNKSNPEWDSCPMMGPKCLDTCSAIRMGGSYHRAFMCP